MEIPTYLQVSPELINFFKNSFDYGGFYNRKDAAKMVKMFVPNASSMSPKFQPGGGVWGLENTNPTMVAPESNFPQIQIDPAQNTAPITTNEIAPDGKQTSINNPQTKNPFASPTREIAKNVVVGANKVFDSGLDFLTQQSEFNPNSQSNAVLNFNRAQENPNNYLNKVGVRTGVAYAKNGGKLPLRFKKQPSNIMYKEGEELDLTTEEIHKLEQQGYKFQTL